MSWEVHYPSEAELEASLPASLGHMLSERAAVADNVAPLRGGSELVMHAESARDERYAGWRGPLGTEILGGSIGLGELADRAVADDLAPSPVSGGQERLENVVNRAVWAVE